jgi:hypothetical protein
MATTTKERLQQIFPSQPQNESMLPSYFQTSSLQNHVQMIYLCWIGHPVLWSFVTNPSKWIEWVFVTGHLSVSDNVCAAWEVTPVTNQKRFVMPLISSALAVLNSLLHDIPTGSPGNSHCHQLIMWFTENLREWTFCTDLWIPRICHMAWNTADTWRIFILLTSTLSKFLLWNKTDGEKCRIRIHDPIPLGEHPVS